MSVSLFDYCTNRCRVSGRSTVHENSYRTQEHHCFGQHGHPKGIILDGNLPVDDEQEHSVANMVESESTFAPHGHSQEFLVEYTVEDGTIDQRSNLTDNDEAVQEVCAHTLANTPYFTWEEVY